MTATKKTLEELETERMAWSREVFPEATALSSLMKLQTEISEAEAELCVHHVFDANNIHSLSEEYVDCLMCLFDSAGRAGITSATLRDAFEKKLAKNKARTWKKNPDNTYSHVK